MKFIAPTAEELSYLRADPLLWEQELDIRTDVAEAVEQATGIRAGRVYWRSDHDYLYSLELADLGRGHPSTATIYGHWDRYEPRPPEHEIDTDLLGFVIWLAGITESIDPSDVERVADFAHKQTGHVWTTWPEDSVLRTPEERFANLPDFPYEPHYVEVEGLRMAYIEQGTGDPILMLHGEPTWGYLYRHMIPPLAKLGRVVVPDLIGFGRSDKPVADNAYSFKSHVRWMRRFVGTLDLKRITLVCQDWGGPIGLRVVSEMPERFSRLVPMNTGITDGSREPASGFLSWRRISQRASDFNVAAGIRTVLSRRTLTDEEAAAYDAPFPSKEYQAAVLNFPRFAPIRPDHPGAYDSRLAIEKLRTLDLPVLLLAGDKDPYTRGGLDVLHSIFRNSAPPISIKDAGHFIQEDAGEEVAEHIRAWMAATP